MSATDRGPRPSDVTPGARAVVELALRSPRRLGRVRLVCIDGPAGAGKTTTAEQVVALLTQQGRTVAVVHLDDLYDGWQGLEGTLWPRLSAQVLEPLRRGLPGRFQRYDWAAGTFADWVDVPQADLLVVEGCGSARRAADAVASVRVWVGAPDDLRLARGLARDGAAAREHWTAWMADEREHFARERTCGRADVRLDEEGRVVVAGPSPDTPAPGRSGLA
ncbi:uridine kinase family protein [Cellulomonas sp. S1-8]|uniref:uridine kinase family protein n=1 Tax=Cellulomonas sp. S1-8 TaxID=2904790 RepID=UPI002243064D|nr:ATP/GTP-binding protein [Cellulomonas sp. S1-8]UZN04990.1 ATP/GTP-binding protein [Cellulomonas sp. S1-8]